MAIVAVNIEPAIFRWVRSLAIEFHRDLGLLVEVVQVARAGSRDGPSLPMGRRQAMGALYVANVVELEHRTGPGLEVSQRDSQA